MIPSPPMDPELIQYYKDWMRKTNPSLPDIYIDAALYLYEHDPDRLNELVDIQMAKGSNSVDDLSEITTIEATVLKQGTPEWEEHMRQIKESQQAVNSKDESGLPSSSRDAITSQA